VYLHIPVGLLKKKVFFLMQDLLYGQGIDLPLAVESQFGFAVVAA
jgi:hypothetical protein